MRLKKILLAFGYRFHYSFFFFNDTATTEIYTLSLHDALPISTSAPPPPVSPYPIFMPAGEPVLMIDRKSTRLNSSHTVISYAVFCLKKKKTSYFIGRAYQLSGDIDAGLLKKLPPILILHAITT